MAINLEKMTRKELTELRADIDKAMRDAEARDRKNAKAAAEKAAAEFGFSLSDISGARASSKASGVAKFANPADTTQTWSGKGRQPQWYKDAVANGVDPKKMEL